MSFTRPQARTLGLHAHPSYWEAERDDLDRICNGAGPSGWGWLVPDTMWGLNVNAASDIHDHDYHRGGTLDDKRRADDYYLENLYKTIEQGAWWLRELRRARARNYWRAVVIGGGKSFNAR